MISLLKIPSFHQPLITLYNATVSSACDEDLMGRWQKVGGECALGDKYRDAFYFPSTIFNSQIKF